MKRNFQKWSVVILFLFLFPIIMNLLPNNGAAGSPKIDEAKKETKQIVYASNILESEIPKAKIEKPSGGQQKALLYFTHNYEAYESVTKAKNGKVAVSHQSENITKFGEKLKTLMSNNGMVTELLPVDNMAEMGKKQLSFPQSYHAIRPYVEQQIKKEKYDLIIDIHRDSVGRNISAMTYDGKQYAKIAFVIGVEHPNYKQNEQKAQRIKDEMEKIVPGITRPLMRKGGPTVDGKYNQDLHPSLILLELGGIGNTEDELNRTLAVMADAIVAASEK